ncbi:hypothetical protein L1987_01532 [Smallanthus sonchifolius]|uniref:Uncharacterized protein n=1 Tax=Smallanthus sonchifolius TaxID=185202 RepID=A0ACB9K5D6_9ASTR|nr:hypothetical protein L1987_01532 [Smallanthus sonchifolius]
MSPLSAVPLTSYGLYVFGFPLLEAYPAMQLKNKLYKFVRRLARCIPQLVAGMPHWGYASVKMMIGGLFKRVMELHHVTL